MMYRAKITRIYSFVEDHYNLRDYDIVTDSKDYYIEVYNEKEAEVLEKLNSLEQLRNELVCEWYYYHE